MIGLIPGVLQHASPDVRRPALQSCAFDAGGAALCGTSRQCEEQAPATLNEERGIVLCVPSFMRDIHLIFSPQPRSRIKSVSAASALSRRTARSSISMQIYAISGSSLRNRPSMQALLDQAKSGKFDYVIAEALDRVSRDQEDIAAIYKRLRHSDIRLLTLAEGEISELHVGLKGTMNALFLKDLAQKIRRGQRGRVEAGKIPGGSSYGYRIIRQTSRRWIGFDRRTRDRSFTSSNHPAHLRGVR